MSRTPSTYEVFFGPTNREVTMKLIRYTIAMFTLPIIVFYAMFYGWYDQNKEMLGWCGIGGVVTANLVIAAYVVMAWNEGKDESTTSNSNEIKKAD